MSLKTFKPFFKLALPFKITDIYIYLDFNLIVLPYIRIHVAILHHVSYIKFFYYNYFQCKNFNGL